MGGQLIYVYKSIKGLIGRYSVQYLPP